MSQHRHPQLLLLLLLLLRLSNFKKKMGVFVPVTRITNHTDDGMVLITVNMFGAFEGKKVISPGGHVDLGYWKGMDRIGADVTFLVRPESRSGVPGREIFPIQVFEYASIDVVFKSVGGSVLREYEDGALVDFYFKKDTLFRRIGLVRWFDGVFAAFGNCYYPAMDPMQAPPPPAAVAQVVAPSPDHYYDMESTINGSALVATLAADIDVIADAAHEGSAPTLLTHEIQKEY